MWAIVFIAVSIFVIRTCTVHGRDIAEAEKHSKHLQQSLGQPLLVVSDRTGVRWRTVTDLSFSSSAAESLPDHSE